MDARLVARIRLERGGEIRIVRAEKAAAERKKKERRGVRGRLKLGGQYSVSYATNQQRWPRVVSPPCQVFLLHSTVSTQVRYLNVDRYAKLRRKVICRCESCSARSRRLISISRTFAFSR